MERSFEKGNSSNTMYNLEEIIFSELSEIAQELLESMLNYSPAPDDQLSGWFVYGPMQTDLEYDPTTHSLIPQIEEQFINGFITHHHGNLGIDSEIQVTSELADCLRSEPSAYFGFN